MTYFLSWLGFFFFGCISNDLSAVCFSHYAVQLHWVTETWFLSKPHDMGEECHFKCLDVCLKTWRFTSRWGISSISEYKTIHLASFWVLNQTLSFQLQNYPCFFCSKGCSCPSLQSAVVKSIKLISVSCLCEYTSFLPHLFCPGLTGPRSEVDKILSMCAAQITVQQYGQKPALSEC